MAEKPKPPHATVWSLSEEAEVFAQRLRLYREGKISEEEFRRFRLQHGVYGERFQPDFVLVRVKLPAGEATAEQLKRIAELAEAYSIGSAHVTTRQDFQIHWIHLDEAPEVLRGLGEVGLTSREACGNTVRNVTCCYLAGVCPREAFDVTPYAKATARYLLRNPLNQRLPRKFKINFSGCERDCGLARIGDIGIVADGGENGGRRFRVYYGGGLGPASYINHPLEPQTREEDLLDTVVAILRLFDRLGDREKMHKNRMRYLVHEMGPEKFRELILRERVVVRATRAVSDRLDIPDADGEGALQRRSDAPPEDGDAEFSRWLATSVVEQKQSGYVAVHVKVPGGDYSADQLREIAQLCRTFSREAKVRTTPQQGILLRWVPRERLKEAYRALRDAGLAVPGAFTVAAAVGCTGATSCNLAITNSHRLAKELQRRLLELKFDGDEGLREVSIKVSGCPNSCGQHGIATIGFFGASVRVGGKEGGLAPAYQMLLGGDVGPAARLGEFFMRVPARRVVDVVTRLFEVYRADRSEGEPFKAWMARVWEGRGGPTAPDREALRGILEKSAEIPPFAVEPLAYSDLGSEERFVVKTARGECAA